MKKFNLSTVLIMSMVFVLVVSAGALAGQVSIKLGFGSQLDPFDASSAGMMYFKQYVETESNGNIKVDLFPANQLGSNDEMLEQVKRGTIEMATSMGSGQLAAKYYPNFYMFDIPYLFKSTKVAWDVVNPNNEFMKGLLEDMAQKSGVRPLGFYVEGRRHFTNNVRSIHTPADMKGLKIRTMSVPAHMEMVKALGASPTPIAYSELYGAMQTGVVDGQENPINNINYLKAYEVQKYVTLDGHITYMVPLVINEKFYQGLNEDQQRIIREGALESFRINNAVSSIQNMIGLKEVKEHGMKVTILTDEQLQQFRDAARPKVLKFIRKQVEDQDIIDELFAEIEKYEY
ncbi:DctP family TRAP transporter solute-binding subunit [Halocella sp. SP3-1]|uniref:TRAP transporter substrate-binding protein n=1 Tax=Halocella sp. SP3-1 TaxID=2382161 RepID=UPI000F7543A0|nr:DctP family TRAP transporter solute-binding subunit [Halocella sp. SP3-1]AZO93519.1 DctP family TRAP transporter solute-binding subunit [Halocella sp. SP3-1]